MQANKNRRLFSFERVILPIIWRISRCAAYLPWLERVMLYQTVKKVNDAHGKSGPRIIMLYQNSPK